MFYPNSKENDERKIAPMSMNAVKFLTAIASCLAVLDKEPPTPDADTENEPAAEPELPTPPAERLGLGPYLARRLATAPCVSPTA